LTNRLPVIS